MRPCCGTEAPGTTLMPHDIDIEHISGLLRSVEQEQIAKDAVQPPTALFQEIQTYILLAHLEPMERGLRNPQLPHSHDLHSPSPSSYLRTMSTWNAILIQRTRDGHAAPGWPLGGLLRRRGMQMLVGMYPKVHQHGWRQQTSHSG